MSTITRFNHRTYHFFGTRTYIMRHQMTGRWFICRNCLDCARLADVLRKPWRGMAWLALVSYLFWYKRRRLANKLADFKRERAIKRTLATTLRWDREMMELGYRPADCDKYGRVTRWDDQVNNTPAQAQAFRDSVRPRKSA